MVIRFNSSAEDNQIYGKGYRTVHRRIEKSDLKTSTLKSNLRLIFQVVPDENHTLFSRFVIIGFIKPVSPHVAVEHIDIYIRVFSLQFQGILHRMTTTDATAVRMLFISGANALNHHHRMNIFQPFIV